MLDGNTDQGPAQKQQNKPTNFLLNHFSCSTAYIYVKIKLPWILLQSIQREKTVLWEW